MASVNLALINPQLNSALTPHRVVPIRFARAVDGFADDTAPDLDDHGFTIPSQFCTALGPVVGLMGPASGQSTGPVVRIKVIRDRLSPDTKLFPTIDSTSVAAIDFPVNDALSSKDTPATASAPARLRLPARRRRHHRFRNQAEDSLRQRRRSGDGGVRCARLPAPGDQCASPPRHYQWHGRCLDGCADSEII
jgi:hypothetical protein